MYNMSEFDLGNKEKFWEIYDESVFPFLKEENKKRKQKMFKTCLKLLCNFVIIFLFIYGILYSRIAVDLPRFVNYIVLCFSVLFALYLLINDVKLEFDNEYTNKLKEKCVNKLMRSFGRIKRVDYSKNSLNINYVESGLFPKKIQESIVDDFYQGKYSDVECNIWDIMLRHKNITYFNGVLLEIKTNKNIKNRTIVCGQKSLNNKSKILLMYVIPLLILFLSVITFYIFLGSKIPIFPHLYIIISCCVLALINFSIIYFAYKIICTKLFDKYDKVSLEDLKFNNMYASYSTDQVEGRYAITPAFMERLLNLKLAFKAKNISASFYDDKLMIAIETKKDLFEIGDLWHPLTDRKYAEDFYNEMSSILRMIEYFKLDENTAL